MALQQTIGLRLSDKKIVTVGGTTPTPTPETFVILQENGDALLAENNDKLIQE